MRQRISTKTFIQRARRVHGRRYDYSKVEYRHSGRDVEIVCRLHGPFWGTPVSHVWDGRGCRRCAEIERQKRAIKDFIANGRRVHGRRYDYSKVEYRPHTEKIEIICRLHGPFRVTRKRHVQGRGGCPHCAVLARRDRWGKAFIAKARQLHGRRYDYSGVKYRTSLETVAIGCRIHGLFWQTPRNHLDGREGCSSCLDEERRAAQLTRFLEKARRAHGYRYDYSKVAWRSDSDKVEIVCRTHGPFWQKATHHVARGHGCPACGASQKKKTQFATVKQSFSHWFVKSLGKRLEIVSAFRGMEEPITVRCKRHGARITTTPNHLKRHGQYSCRQCKGGRRRSAVGRKAKPVRCIDTGRVFPSALEAARAGDVSVSAIRVACSGRTEKAGAHRWEYVDARACQ